MRKDKATVTDEVWDDARVQSFLDREPPVGVTRDHHALLTAYQSMRADDFARFLAFFSAAGRDLNAVDQAGRSVADVIKPHRLAGPYLEALQSAGAHHA